MLSTAILDVAIGLIFTFLAVSLAAGAVVESVASLLKLRSTTLKTGIMQVLNDPNFDQLAKRLYAHALVNPRGPGATPNPPPKAAKILPTYIDPKQFASALIDVLSLVDTAGTPLSVANMLQAVDANVPQATNPQINRLLHGIILRTAGDLARIHAELAGWFDNAMDRVSGVYKRYTQVITFTAALAISGLANADAFQVAQRVWAEPAQIANLKADAPSVDPKVTWQMVESLPIGWAAPPTTCRAWFFAVIGWLLTAVASLFGAPFWFDALQRVTRLKGSGPGPADKTTTAA